MRDRIQDILGGIGGLLGFSPNQQQQPQTPMINPLNQYQSRMGFNQPQLRTEPRESLEHLALGQTDYDPTALNMPNTTVASGLVEPIPQPEQPQEQGFMSKVGDYLGNEENRLQMALAFNTMRLEPDDALATSIENRLENIRSRKKVTRSVAEMRRLAMTETDPAKKQRYLNMAIMAEKNPDQAKDILSQFMQEKYGVGASDLKAYQPRYDEEGKEYIPVYNPNTGTVEKKYTGVTGMSDRQKIQFETEEKLRQDDLSRRDTESAKIFAQAENITGQISKVQGIIEAIDEGAMSGWLAKNFPTFNRASANLNQLANQLGLQLIGSVTFGALSEAELNLAMETVVPRDLAPKELKDWAIRKLQAQQKLRNELYKKASEMSRSKGFNAWIQDESKSQLEHSQYDYYNLPKNEQGQVSYSEWQDMNLAQRKKYLKVIRSNNE